MPELYCVRADFAKYTPQFLNGGYVGIGWFDGHDLRDVSNEELYALFRKDYPDETSNNVIGVQVGQIARFMFDIGAGDYVITPSTDNEYIHYGVVADEPCYFYADVSDGCPYRHRKRVNWHPDRILRSAFSIPFQNTIRSLLAVFRISHNAHFFEVIGKAYLSPQREKPGEYDYYTTVLQRILELDPREFELLITQLLSALGFEGSEHTGKSGDGGVDATGELNVANMAKVKIFVQAKRYALNHKITANTVKALRQSIPSNGQGAFITTSDYHAKAHEVALESNFPRIGLINGHQLVDLLVEHWDGISEEFKAKLNLKLGLVVG
jgi:predicted Mrr-cat superfamily restriction endonuclease